MSRMVPMDRALTDEDRRYLRQLGANGSNLEARLDRDFPPDPDELAEFNLDERKAAAEINGMGLTVGDQNDLAAENERLRAQLAALTGEDPPGKTAVENYNGWKKADLEAEVDRVNAEDEEAKLPKGTVEEMKDALRAYFE